VKLRSPSLFWRTFLLILLLIVASLAAWVQSFRVFEREPRAQQIAQQVASIVNLTRSALLYSDPATRRFLLAELADNEGIRIVPLEAGDQVKSFPDIPIVELVSKQVIERLGPATRIAAEVNGIAGIWVSFDIEGDRYWVFIERDPLAREAGTLWIRWAILAMVLSVLAAIAITGVVNRPLKKLSTAARELGAGRTPTPLPDKGPVEIRMVNASFNRMVGDLAKLEQDRAVLLAGISHDLRTPLTRLRLELEINELPAEARSAMIGDIEQIDAIVGQFLDYARPAPQQAREEVDLSALVEDVLMHARVDEWDKVRVERRIAPDIRIPGYRTELTRALENLLANAARYGRDPSSDILELVVELQVRAGQAVIALSDRGPGIERDSIERLMRPFERGDKARSGGAGAGLGLAIVDRIARLHGGTFALDANEPYGLRAQLRIPLARASSIGG
jgi:two-component system osmolarity sensor histidine kinase EnvZ